MSVRQVALAVACVVVAVRDTKPTLQQSQAGVPQLSPDRGRTHFYRTDSVFGAAIQPYAKFDEVAVGGSAASCLIESRYLHV